MDSWRQLIGTLDGCFVEVIPIRQGVAVKTRFRVEVPRHAAVRATRLRIRSAGSQGRLWPRRKARLGDPEWDHAIITEVPSAEEVLGYLVPERREAILAAASGLEDWRYEKGLLTGFVDGVITEKQDLVDAILRHLRLGRAIEGPRG